MKKLLCFVVALAMLLGSVAFAEETSGLQKDLVILFTSDVHCGMDQNFGYAGLKGVKDQLSLSNYVLLVDNGDSIQGEAIGSLTKGEACIEMMNAVGYDIATIGNHEFDYGMENFMSLVEKASFPYVCCNFSKDGELVFKPYVIKEFDGVKIAFVGITTPTTFVTSTPTYFMDENGNFIYSFAEDETGEKLYAAVQTAVDSARAEGAQYVIALAHLGIEAEVSPYMSSEVIQNTTGIDALLDGHSHSTLESNIVKNKDNQDVYQAACGTKLEKIGYCKISKEGDVSTGLYTWTLPASASDFLGLKNDVSEKLDATNADFDEMLNTVVAKTSVDLIIADPETGTRVIRNTETNLGNLVSDAYRSQTGADVALVNGGGIRATIPAGDITLNQIIACHPFGNMLCMVKATGQQILDALEWSTRSAPGESGGFLHVSGLTFDLNTTIESTCTANDKGLFTGVAGDRRVSNVIVNGEPLDVEKEYTVASHNYMLKSGGDGTSMFMDDEILLDEIKYDYQTVIDYIINELGGVVGEEYENIWGQGRMNVISE